MSPAASERLHGVAHGAGTLLGVAVLTAVAAAPSFAGEWREQVHPLISDREESLQDVAAVGARDVWAVGLQDSSQPPFAGRLTMHWDGTAWNTAPAGDFGSLNGVALAGGHAWAVGQNIDESLVVTRRK